MLDGLPVAGTPQELTARWESQSFVVEAGLKQDLPARAGETIIIPSPPDSSPPEWPLPSEPTLPPYHEGEGRAWIVDSEGVYVTDNFYSFYPNWRMVLSKDIEPGSNCAAMRYVERGLVHLVMATDHGGLYYHPDANGSVESGWQCIITAEQLRTLAARHFGMEWHASYFLHLMTLVHRPNYIGMIVVFANFSNYANYTTYCYTDDWGNTWHFYSDGWWRMSVYTRKCLWLENTAGTDELMGLFGTGIFGSSTMLYRSLDRGATWSAVCDLGTASTCKFRKPWQWGVSGRLVYKTGMPWSAEQRLGRSTDNGCTFTELIDPGCGDWTGHGMEVWTFDPGKVVVVLNAVDGYRFYTLDGGVITRRSNVPVYTRGILNVGGNPANRNEWTVWASGGEYAPDRTDCLLANTLDDGLTWVDVTGDYRGFWRRPQCFLITPPFAVRSRE